MTDIYDTFASVWGYRKPTKVSDSSATDSAGLREARTPMDALRFASKWKSSKLSERSSYVQHFLDLCSVLGEKPPAEVDPTGEWFTIDKSLNKNTGGKGFADVWKKGFFGLEYKGKKKHKDLSEAYQQLLQYREALDNPPFLLVCDINTIEIHTNFTGYKKEMHEIDLDHFATPENLAKLRAVFFDPDRLKPGATQREVTEDIASKFAELANGLQERGISSSRSARFLMKLMFCMFSEDVGLLPKKLFARTIENTNYDPAKFKRFVANLFHCMAVGDPYGADDILWFNGGLFSDAEVLDLTKEDIKILFVSASSDWSAIDPSIFGTVFERILDPNKRAQLGTHYTCQTDIEEIVNPVIMKPLREEWEVVSFRADSLWEYAKKTKPGSKQRIAFENCVGVFLKRLESVTILDPACGSGNFLYVSINMLLDLEKEVLTYINAKDQEQMRFPGVRPTQLKGIESNKYAHELAQVVIWIGYLQWMKFNGFVGPTKPVLDPMENIEWKDALLDLTDPENPKESTWPPAEFIVGNPPFLGGRMLRGQLGDAYVNSLYKTYAGRIPKFNDLCCYWFEKARQAIKSKQTRRAGLLATQGIRGGQNREVLKKIKADGDIYFAVSDRDWVLDGANVHISMVGFDNGDETTRVLNGQNVIEINPDLTTGAKTTTAVQLVENSSIGFQGIIKRGSFDMPDNIALQMLAAAGNPHSRPNSDVILPSINAIDITRRPRKTWIIAMSDMDYVEAAKYQAPFERLKNTVYHERQKAAQPDARRDWWKHWRPRPEMKAAQTKMARFLITPIVSKHRLFTWLSSPLHPDHALVVFARSDDYFFGVLHSRIHEVWSRMQGTQVRERESGFRYTPTTCFESFPFPSPTAKQTVAIAIAAKEIDELRTRWLNPTEWTIDEMLEFPASKDGPWSRYVSSANEKGVGIARYPRIVPKDEVCATSLEERTLTKLYNKPETWLLNAHRKLDEAVFAAYGWPVNLSDAVLLDKLLDLNHHRAGIVT